LKQVNKETKISIQYKIINFYLLNGFIETLKIYYFIDIMEINHIIDDYLKNPYEIMESKIN